MTPVAHSWFSFYKVELFLENNASMELLFADHLLLPVYLAHPGDWRVPNIRFARLRRIALASFAFRV